MTQDPQNTPPSPGATTPAAGDGGPRPVPTGSAALTSSEQPSPAAAPPTEAHQQQPEPVPMLTRRGTPDAHQAGQVQENGAGGHPLFRKEARSATSPEQLTRLLQVTSARGWLALAALLALIVAVIVWGIFGKIATTTQGEGVIMREGGLSDVVAPRAGIIVSRQTHVGDQVAAGQTVFTIEQSDGSRYEVKSLFAGQVAESLTSVGNMVDIQQPLLSIEPTDVPLIGLLFVPAGTGKLLTPGMEVQVSPATVPAEQFGAVLGTVRSVSQYPATPRSVQSVLQNEPLVQQVLGADPKLEVHVELEMDSSAPSGFRWSSGKGPNIQISSGTLATGEFILAEQSPLGLVLPASS